MFFFWKEHLGSKPRVSNNSILILKEGTKINDALIFLIYVTCGTTVQLFTRTTIDAYLLFHPNLCTVNAMTSTAFIKAWFTRNDIQPDI